MVMMMTTTTTRAVAVMAALVVAAASALGPVNVTFTAGSTDGWAFTDTPEGVSIESVGGVDVLTVVATGDAATNRSELYVTTTEGPFVGDWANVDRLVVVARALGPAAGLSLRVNVKSSTPVDGSTFSIASGELDSSNSEFVSVEFPLSSFEAPDTARGVVSSLSFYSAVMPVPNADVVNATLQVANYYFVTKADISPDLVPLAFAATRYGETAAQNATFSNAGTLEATVSAAARTEDNSDGVLALGTPSAVGTTVAGLGELNVPVAFSPTEAGGNAATLNATFTVTVGGENVTVVARGRGTPGLADTAALAYSATAVGASRNATAAPRNDFDAEVSVTAVTVLGAANGTDFAVASPATLPVALAAGSGTLPLTLTWTPSAEGALSGVTVRIDTAAHGSYTLDVSGTAIVDGPGIAVSPTSVAVSNINSTGLISRTVDISSTGAGTLSVYGAAFVGTGATEAADLLAVSFPEATPIALAPSAQTNVTVSGNVTKDKLAQLRGSTVSATLRVNSSAGVRDISVLAAFATSAAAAPATGMAVVVAWLSALAAAVALSAV